MTTPESTLDRAVRLALDLGRARVQLAKALQVVEAARALIWVGGNSGSESDTAWVALDGALDAYDASPLPTSTPDPADAAQGHQAYQQAIRDQRAGRP